MDARHCGVVATLASLSDGKLNGLMAMVDEGLQLAPSLFAWVAHDCDWERHCRCGKDFRLCSPEEAIEPGEIADAALVVALLRSVFGWDDPLGKGSVFRLLNAMLAALGPTGQASLNS